MNYVSPETVALAKQVDLLSYLQSADPGQLVRVSGDTYCTREHDSLKISNGKWHWFSQGIGGRTALDYLIKVQGMGFVDAVEAICGRQIPVTSYSQIPRATEPRKLLMPEISPTAENAVRYLKGRGIHPVIIDYCLEHNLLFETAKYHNVAFVGYDRNGKARYAALRGTLGNYKGEITGSDKHYSFCINPGSKSGHVHLFEAAIDAMSYATLQLIEGEDWKADTKLSLAGVYRQSRENVVPIALTQYLKDYPETSVIHLHLDNDEVGRSASQGIIGGLSDKYTVLDEPPECGKDVNDELQMRVGIIKRKEEFER